MINKTMKTNLAIIITLLIAATSIGFAQAAYTVEPGTKQNTITLDVTNKSGKSLNDLQLTVDKSPSWVKIVEKHLSVQRVGVDSTVLVSIVFDVAVNAKAGEKEGLGIVLSSGSTRVMQKNIALAIATPQTYALNQNYPNPFNPTTTIEYQLPTASRVSLKVFDVLGREVATLVDEVQASGFKSAEFSATRIASGVYFYRMEARALDGSPLFRGLRKLMVVK
jgi:hypothetical protein